MRQPCSSTSSYFGRFWTRFLYLFCTCTSRFERFWRDRRFNLFGIPAHTHAVPLRIPPSAPNKPFGYSIYRLSIVVLSLLCTCHRSSASSSSLVVHAGSLQQVLVSCQPVASGDHRFDSLGYAGLVSPTILRIKGFRFYFFSREERRAHVHVQHAEAKPTSGLNQP